MKEGIITLKALLLKLKEAAFSVLPVAVLIFIVTLTPLVDVTLAESIAFLVCSFALLIGIALFSLGAEIAMTPMGEHVGVGLTKSGKAVLLLVVSFILGVAITIAEPDLSVLATQVKEVINSTLLIVSVGVGVGIFLVFAVLRVIFRQHLNVLLLFFYMLLFSFSALVAVNGNEAFLSVAFDSGGVTTGPITVPFIMALGVGVATTLGGKDSHESSFGFIALCSVGPILAVTLLGVFMSGTLSYRVPDYSMKLTFDSILHTLTETMSEVGISLGLLVAFFFVLDFWKLHLPKKRIVQILIGLVYTFVGLVVFLAAVKIAFMPVGYKIGMSLSQHPALVVGLSVLLGMVCVLAEPAIHVLNKQVEEITEGAVSRRSMLIALSIGIGAAIGLSVLRIFWDFNILFYLIPGYLLSFALSFFVPKMYTAIAFDSGGVASGPLMSGFILPFAVGVCMAVQGEAAVLSDAFGIISMVALAPLISIQALGFKGVIATKIKKKRMLKKIYDKGDMQIIDFSV